MSDVVTEEDRQEKILKNFDEAHGKVLGILEEYVSGGYAESFARILVYLGKERAEKLLSEMPEEMGSKIRKVYEEISEKEKSDADVIAAAGPVLKKAGFYGKTMADAVIAGLKPSDCFRFVERNDDFLSEDPIIALNLERYIVLFDDLLDLDDRSIQKVLREVDGQILAMALKNASAEIQDKIFRNMSRRASAMLKEDMEFMGPVRISDIERAKDKIIKIVRRLDETGEIVLFSNDILVN